MNAKLKRFITIMFMIGLVVSVFPAALYAANESPADGSALAQEDEDLTTVRVGVIPVMIHSTLYIADARGYFAEEGIEIEYFTQPGGSEPLAPLARGELDVVFGGTGSGLFNYAARNIETEGDPNFRIVAGAHIERPPLTSPLVVSRERYESGEITSVADLEGKRVAINAAGAATEYWLYLALQQGGLSMDDVEVVALPFPDVPAALNSPAEDRLDASILGEPIAAAAEAQGLIVRLSDDFLDGFQPTFIYMANDFIEEDRELAIGFLRAMVRTYRDLQDHDTWRDEAIVEMLTENTIGFSEELLDFYAFPYFDPNGDIYVEDMETLQTYFMEKGDLAYEEELDIADLIDESLLEAVIADLGEYEAPEAE